MADQLSPADQVMIAVAHVYQEHGGEPPARAVAAAALRAAADQVVPVHPMVVPGGRSYEATWSATVQDKIRADILAIAAELEAR